MTGPTGGRDARSCRRRRWRDGYETEVEAPLEGASAPAGSGRVDAQRPAVGRDVNDDLSDLDWVARSTGRGRRPRCRWRRPTADEADQAPPEDGRPQLLERTADLQRLQAEFLNYKRRVERDRVLITENATYKVLQPIIEVLDTIDRAREHGELEGGFKSVADQLERVVAGLGLTKFGTPGDAFDPTVHEALSHIGEDAEVSVTTAKVIAKSGYKINDRVVRAAQVLVVDPATPTE